MNKSKIIYICYLAVISIAIAVIFEFVILPWHFHLPRDIALMGFAGVPNTIVDDTAINSMGFTGDILSERKDPGKVRILTLGGSVMFNRRMTERLKEKLAEVSGRPVEIMGAALRTHTSMSSLLKYRVLSKYKFDYVFIYHAINDLFVNNVRPDQFKSDYSHMVPWYKRNFLLDHSLIARLIYNKFIWGKRIFGMEKVWYIYPQDSDVENLMNFVSEKLFRRNMTLLVKEIKKNGAVPVLMTFAWDIPDNYTREAFESGKAGYAKSNFKTHPVELWGSPEFVKEGLQRHNKVIREISKEYNVLLLDQENLMGKNMRWFEDVCHLSEDGVNRFVRYIAEFYQEHIMQ